jgi:hypothetical protein
MAENGKGDDAQGTDPQSGVLGNLPRSRPSVRSPRRAAATPDPPVGETAGSATRAAEPQPSETSSQAELEALARSGLAIAGGAATLGLRIAGRAAAAVRGAVERR